jgi:hypothetical protein
LQSPAVKRGSGLTRVSMQSCIVCVCVCVCGGGGGGGGATDSHALSSSFDPGLRVKLVKFRVFSAGAEFYPNYVKTCLL